MRQSQPPDLIVRSRRVVTGGEVRPADVAIRDGRIAEILEHGRAPAGGPMLEAGSDVVMAGVVDTHVHVNEPGRTEWEGFQTATQAAAAGGVTTLVDMPLNSSPVTTTARALQEKIAAARGRTWVDVGFWGGVVPGNAAELAPMIAAGALGFKAFLIHSGIDDFPASGEADLRQALAVLAERGAPLLAHAELEVAAAALAPGAAAYADYLASRPRVWENAAVALLAKLCGETGARVHVVHLSSAGALDSLHDAKSRGLPLTAETCPHYLHFESGKIPNGATEYKCAPPIREAENRERLWDALGEGLLDFVVSDHSPCAPELKRKDSGDFAGAWGGISSVQFGLPAVWTEARARGRSLPELALWLCERPAAFAGLARKGKIAPGFDADLVIWDPEASFVVERRIVRHRHKLTPYTGATLHGVVKTTLLRGQGAFVSGNIPAEPRGRLLLDSDRRIAG